MAAKSSIDDAAVAADVVEAHMTEHFEVALVGIAAEVLYNTFADSAAAAKEARHTCGVDHAWMEMLPMLESSIEECGMRLEGMGATSARLP